MTEPNIKMLSSSIKDITDLKGTSLATLGAIVAILGQVFENRTTTVMGIGMFIPGMLSGVLDISNNYITASRTIPKEVLNSLIGVVLMLVIGFFLVSRTNFVVNLVLLTGFTLLISGYMNQKSEIQPRVEYKFIPRTFKEEQENPVRVSDVFSGMFSEPSPWVYNEDNVTNKLGRRDNPFN